jgi:peptidoglycan-associated lipoprotein
MLSFLNKRRGEMRNAIVLLMVLFVTMLIAGCCQMPEPWVEPIPVVEPPPPPPEPEPEPKPPPPKEPTRQASIYFDYNSSALTPQARDSLRANAAELHANPGATIRLEGNCDDRGNVEYNRGLGERRANAARDYLISLGVPEPQIISIVSNSNVNPRYPGQTEDARTKNRRVDSVLITR